VASLDQARRHGLAHAPQPDPSNTLVHFVSLLSFLTLRSVSQSLVSHKKTSGNQFSRWWKNLIQSQPDLSAQL
jgi:hypothetical protein